MSEEKTQFNPGEQVPLSGIYTERLDDESKEPFGDVINKTCVKGEPFPPTTHPGMHYVLVQRSDTAIRGEEDND